MTAAGFRATLLRAVRVPAVVLAAAVVSLATVSLTPGDRSLALTPSPSVEVGTTSWPTSYSQRFPGCVAPLLWPHDEVPKAVMLRDPDGTVDAMPVRQAAERFAVSPQGDRPRLVGVCR